VSVADAKPPAVAKRRQVGGLGSRGTAWSRLPVAGGEKRPPTGRLPARRPRRPLGAHLSDLPPVQENSAIAFLASSAASGRLLAAAFCSSAIPSVFFPVFTSVQPKWYWTMPLVGQVL
jgi:hypothetical protein